MVIGPWQTPNPAQFRGLVPEQGRHFPQTGPAAVVYRQEAVGERLLQTVLYVGCVDPDRRQEGRQS